MKRFLVAIPVLVGLLSIGAAAQSVATAELHVTVKDPNGRLVTNATVTVRDESRGIERTLENRPDGEYPFLSLPPGQYMVTVEAGGFARATAVGVRVTVGQAAELPVTLNVSGQKTEVTVSGETEMVETQQTSVSTTINQQRIDNLPINGRNYINFTLLNSQTVLRPACRAAIGLIDGLFPTLKNGVPPGAPNGVVLSDPTANYSNGSSVYHGLTVNLRKRFSQKYEFLVSYTWSHAIDDSTDLQAPLSPQDSYNPAAERSNSSFDQRHRFVFSSVYQSGRHSGSGFWSKFLSDWTVAPIIEVGSGRPFTILAGGQTNFQLEPFSARPNAVRAGTPTDA